MKLVTSLFLALLGAGFACPRYQCGANTDVCAAGDSNSSSYTISPCEDSSQICPVPSPYANSTCSDTTTPSNGSKYPSESCSSHSECYTGNCTNSVCLGADSGEECIDGGDCNPGLSCFNYTCAPALQVNQTGCTQETDCVNSATCDLLAKTCIPYFSAPARKFIGDCDCDSNISRTCASNFCVCLQGPNVSKGVCAGSPVSPLLPRPCSSSNDCGAIASDGRTYKSHCTCGYTTYGNSYCSLFPADTPYIQYLSLLQEFIASPKLDTSCNVKGRFSPDCIKKVKGNAWYTQYRRAELLVNLYPQLQDNQSCIRQTFTREYWQSYNQSQFFSTA